MKKTKLRTKLVLNKQMTKVLVNPQLAYVVGGADGPPWSDKGTGCPVAPIAAPAMKK